MTIIALRRLLAVTVFFALCAGAGRAGEAVSPKARKADEIIRKHVQAVGGLDKIRAIRTLLVSGHLAQQGLDLPFTIRMKRPNKSRMDVDLKVQSIIQAYNGRSAWWVNPLLGIASPAKMPDEIAKMVTRWTDFEGPLVGYAEKGHTAEFEGKVTTDSGALYKIKLTLRDGDVWQVYLDANTYLEVKRTFQQAYGGKTSEVTTWFPEYTTVDGVRIYRVIRGEGIDGTPYTITFDSFQANVAIDDNIFERP